ncbi:MAG: cobyrinate a,c-diamide synthase [bacterium]
MTSAIRVPRLVIAGAASGVGKTTTVVALAAALRARGLRVATFKCGPDYLDPTYHARVIGGASPNLDGWMMGREAVLATFERASRDADVALVEGVMGLFDGASPTSDEGSTAEIAKWLAAPVLVCIDVSGMARTVAAVARGLAAFDGALRVAGVLGMGVGSNGHLKLLRESCPSPPVLGGLPRLPELSFPERHLGLRRADTETVPTRAVDDWGRVAADWLDLDAILAVARSAPELVATAAAPPPALGRESLIRIAIASDEAFHFYYDDNLARLQAAGAELVMFSPLHSAVLPQVDGVYLGGGYPELHAEALAANHSMLDSLRAFAAADGAIYGECGGLMYLSQAIRTLDGQTHSMLGLVPGVAVMHERLQALGYVEVETLEDSLLGPRGSAFRGHEFRHSVLAIDERAASSGVARPAYAVKRRRGGAIETTGVCVKRVLASYVHAHWASNPTIPEHWVASCRSWRAVAERR